MLPEDSNTCLKKRLRGQIGSRAMQKGALRRPFLRMNGKCDDSSVAVIMVVIVVIPVALIVPAMIVFIPPAVRMLPTVGARFGEFVAPVLSLGTLPTMVFDRLVQVVVCLSDAFLAIVARAKNGRKSKQETNGDCQAHKNCAERRQFCSHVLSKVDLLRRRSDAR